LSEDSKLSSSSGPGPISRLSQRLDQIEQQFSSRVSVNIPEVKALMVNQRDELETLN
jgi:hypothetical protein